MTHPVRRVLPAQRMTVSLYNRFANRLLAEHPDWDLVGWLPETDEPLTVRFEDWHTHGWVLGNTGAGKTSRALTPRQASFIRRAGLYGGLSVVIVDFGEDKPQFTGAQIEARDAGLPFYYFAYDYRDGYTSHVWNPFIQSHTAQLPTDVLTGDTQRSLGLLYSDEYGAMHFALGYQAVLSVIFDRAKQLGRPIRSFRELQWWLHNKSVLQQHIEPKHLEEARDLKPLVDALARIPHLNVTPDGLFDRDNRHLPVQNGSGPPKDPKELLREGIDLYEACRRPAVVYFWLPSAQNPTSRRLGTLALFSLLQAKRVADSDHQRRTCESPHRVVCFIDEFQHLAADHITWFFEEGRKRRISTIVSNQNIAQLLTRGGSLLPVVWDNTNVKLIFGASDPDFMEFLQRASGDDFGTMDTLSRRALPLLPQPPHYTIEHDDLVETVALGEALQRIWPGPGPYLSKNDIISTTRDPGAALLLLKTSRAPIETGFPHRFYAPYHIEQHDYEERSNFLDHPWPEEAAHTLRTNLVVPTGDTPAPRAPTPRASRRQEVPETDEYGRPL